MLVRLRGRCRLTDKFSVLSEPLHARRIGFGSYNLDAETSSVSSVFVVRGYLRPNAQNQHPFHHLPFEPFLHDVMISGGQLISDDVYQGLRKNFKWQFARFCF